MDSDISCYGLFQFASSFSFDNKKYPKIFYYIYIKKISNSDRAKNMVRIISILFIYFCQFYVILFDKIFNYNCQRYGKCVLHDYVIDKNHELYLLDKVNAYYNSRENYYKNNLNDSYFNTLKNTNKQNDLNTNKNVKIAENSENKDKTNLSRKELDPLNVNIIRISSNFRSNK